MKQALKVVDEIKNLQAAINKSKSTKLKADYNKAIKRKRIELKEYCGYKDLNYMELIKQIV